jgi:hypothetical protein
VFCCRGPVQRIGQFARQLVEFSPARPQSHLFRLRVVTRPAQAHNIVTAIASPSHDEDEIGPTMRDALVDTMNELRQLRWRNLAELRHAFDRPEAAELPDSVREALAA